MTNRDGKWFSSLQVFCLFVCFVRIFLPQMAEEGFEENMFVTGLSIFPLQG